MSPAVLTMRICDRDRVHSPFESMGPFFGRGQALHKRSKSEDLGCAREETADNADIFFRAFRRRSCP